MSEFERWENRFSVPDYIFGTEPNAFLKAQARLLPKIGYGARGRRRRGAQWRMACRVRA
jgi:hypothetical protein